MSRHMVKRCKVCGNTIHLEMNDSDWNPIRTFHTIKTFKQVDV